MVSLHDFLPCFPVMTPYQSQTAFMFPRHVPRHVPLYVPLHVPLYVPLHVPLYVPLHVSLYVSRHDFLPNLSTKQPSWFPVMASYHGFPPWLPSIAPLHGSPTMAPLPWLPFMTLYHITFMFPVMTPIKKVMQKGNAKAKNRKNFYI